MYFLNKGISTLLIVFISCFFLFQSCNNHSDSNPSGGMFEYLPSEKTGVSFENRLEEGPNTNVLVYEYFYNGGGVAVADFNSDGFMDLYFTSNMGENKLYVNESNDGFTFKDMTLTSGAGGRPGPWKTGVSIVDINADGKPDIYLCYSGAMPADKRRNQLFINTTPVGSFEVTFEEKSAEYGLDSPAYSTMAYFLDYDRDGDLDMFLLNHNPENLPNLNEAQTLALNKIQNQEKGSRLFRNDGGRFSDITESAGINGSELSYGLGAGISDVNDDGWPDIYVSNDYNVPDYLYINNKNGTYSNQIQAAMTHTSHFSMGNDVADVNNDGTPDILTLDMLPQDSKRQKLLMAPDNWSKFELNVRSGFHHQFMRNMLQLNNADGTFSEAGQLAGISNTDWSWSALLADYDNDGMKDVYITNGYLRDFTNLDFINFMDQKIKEKGRFSRSDVLELIEKMPASDVVNYMFRSKGELQFENVTQAWGFSQPANSNGAAYADFDNDGDLDLVVNNINKPASIIKNNHIKDVNNHYLMLELKGEQKNTMGIGAKVRIFVDGKVILTEQNPARGFQSCVSPVLHVGLGPYPKSDTLEIIWASGKKQVLKDVKSNQRLYLNESEANSDEFKPANASTFFSPENENIFATGKTNFLSQDFDRQGLIMQDYSKKGADIIAEDVDGDGNKDLVKGGVKGEPAKVYLWKNGRYLQQENADFMEDKDCHDACIELTDVNNDGKPDIIIGSGGYHDYSEEDERLIPRLYMNQSNGKFKKVDFGWQKPISAGKILSFDINGDGFTDLFIGGRLIPGRWPETPASYLLINDGKGKFVDKTKEICPELAKSGMITDAVYLDINNDKKSELIIAGEGMPIRIYTLQNSKLINTKSQFLETEMAGFWNCIKAEDLTGDGVIDLIFGNIGLNHQLKVKEKYPVEIVYSDFDDNGSIDPILCTYILNDVYPLVTRDELFKQLPYLKKKFTNYEDFSNAQLKDIFSDKELKNSNKLIVNQLETVFLKGNNNAKFQMLTLPIQMQSAPVNRIETGDVNGDGFKDLMVFGNNSNFQLKLGMITANKGQCYIGDGKGNFSYVPQNKSGLKVKGDVYKTWWMNEKLYVAASGQAIQPYKTNKR